MLENAYIEKYKKENYELYNIENTLEDVLSNKRKLLICEEIANYVVVSQFLKNKYVYDYMYMIIRIKDLIIVKEIQLKI